MIDKKAAADHKITELIAERWSPRAFSDKNLEPEKILSLFEAARWAPSAFNEQPWRFITASKSDPQEFEKMLSCLAKSNQVWAKRAQMLIILVVKNKFDYNGKPNRWAMHDCGLALENLLLEAAAQGLLAGLNAARQALGKSELVLARHTSYLGTLVDDLVTKGVMDPYRWTASSSKVNGGSQSKNKAFGGQTYY